MARKPIRDSKGRVVGYSETPDKPSKQKSSNVTTDANRGTGRKKPRREKREPLTHQERREVSRIVGGAARDITRTSRKVVERESTRAIRAMEHQRFLDKVNRLMALNQDFEKPKRSLLDQTIQDLEDFAKSQPQALKHQTEAIGGDIYRAGFLPLKPRKKDYTFEGTREFAEEQGRGAVETARHPLRHPGNTILLGLALAAGGKGLVKGGRRVAGGRASEPEPVPEPKPSKKELESEDKVASVLPEAAKTRDVQEAAWRPVRGERFSKTRKEFGGAGGGLKGHYAATSQLKGELPKIPFKRLKEIGYSKRELDRDITRIYEHPDLLDGEAISAAEGLKEMALNEVVPQRKQIELLNQVFGPEKTAKLVAKSIPHHLGEIVGLSRSLMTTGDLSRLLRQSLPLFFRNPKMWAESIGPQVKALASEKKFQESREARFADPDYQELQRIQPGLLTDIEGVGGPRSEYYPSTLAEKPVKVKGKNVNLPGKVVRASGRAFEEGQDLNILRSYKAMKERARKWGVNINPHTPEGLRELKGMAEVAGAQAGRGIFKSELFGKAAPLLGKGLFAPSFYKSRLTWFSPRWYYKLPKVARYEAARTMLQFLGGSAAILYGASKIPGVTVAEDPRSTDFAKIKIGNTRLDTLGGFQQYARLAAQIYKGQYIDTETGEVIDMGSGFADRSRWDTLMNFATTKASPPASFIIDLFKGTDYQHRPFEWKRAVVQRMTPLVLQDMKTVYDQTGSAPAAAAAFAGAGVGVGVQTYTKDRAKKARQKEFKAWEAETEKQIGQQLNATVLRAKQKDYEVQDEQQRLKRKYDEERLTPKIKLEARINVLVNSGGNVDETYLRGLLDSADDAQAEEITSILERDFMWWVKVLDQVSATKRKR